MDISNWSEPDPALVASPADDKEWEDLLARYRTSLNDVPFDRCVHVARSLGAKTIVIETRYADLDYRSEHHALYDRAFKDYPAYAHRLHFFSGTIDVSHLTALPADHGYIGHIVVRPVVAGLVARAMLPPPPDVQGIRCAETETVRFFGQELQVTGVPFAQQDTQIGACAHAAAWVCHYTGFLRGDVARQPRAEFALLADESLAPARAVPSQGLTVQQLSDVLRKLGLPPIFNVMGALPRARLPWAPGDPVSPAKDALGGTWDNRVFAVMCRYLNSGYPVLVGTNNHAFVVVGWNRDPADPSRIIFTRHDDQRGPYLTVENPLADTWTDPHGVAFNYGPWRTLQVPVPPDLWLAPEPAETKAGRLMQVVSKQLAPLVGIADDLVTLISGDHLALRTYATTSEGFKAALPALGLDRHHVDAYRLMRLPRWIWVVEAVDRRARGNGDPPVIGEAIIDATSPDGDPEVLAYRLHGRLMWQATDGSVGGPVVGSADLTQNGGRTA